MSKICKTSLENKELQYQCDWCHSREILKWCRAAKAACKKTSALGLEKFKEVIILYSVKLNCHTKYLEFNASKINIYFTHY